MICRILREPYSKQIKTPEILKDAGYMKPNPPEIQLKIVKRHGTKPRKINLNSIRKLPEITPQKTQNIQKNIGRNQEITRISQILNNPKQKGNHSFLIFNQKTQE